MQILKPKQKSVPISEYNRLKKTLQDELKRKDKQIQALKKRIEILFFQKTNWNRFFNSNISYASIM